MKKERFNDVKGIILHLGNILFQKLEEQCDGRLQSPEEALGIKIQTKLW